MVWVLCSGYAAIDCTLFLVEVYSVLQVGCPSEIRDRLLCLKWLVRL